MARPATARRSAYDRPDPMDRLARGNIPPVGGPSFAVPAGPDRDDPTVPAPAQPRTTETPTGTPATEVIAASLWSQLSAADRDCLGRHFSRLLLRAARCTAATSEGR